MNGNRRNGGAIARQLGLWVLVLVSGSAIAGDWLQFGGPNGDFKVDDEGLAASWPDAGPKELWSRDLGGGYTSIVVHGDRLYTMFRRGDDEVVAALNRADGKTVWEHSYPAKPLDSQNLQFGSGPNATPLVIGNRLFTVGFLNEMFALDLDSGEVLWSKDLTEEFGTPIIEFGYASSPIAYGGAVLILTGGTENGAVALNPKNGKVTWTAPPVPISYSTPQIARIDDQDLLVFMAPTEVVAISMEASEIVWRYKHQNQWDTNCLGPWFGDDDLVFVSSSGEAGSRTLRLKGTELEEVSASLKFKASTGSVIREGTVAYGSNRTTMVGYDIVSGEVLWTEKGPYEDANQIVVGKRSLLLGADGTLSLATLTPEGFELHAQHRVLEKPALTPPALVGTTLYLRDQKRLVALDLAGG